MRTTLIACLFFVCTEAAALEAPWTVVACDDLVTLRRLMMQEHDAGTIPVEFGGCRAVPADRIGGIEKRAMIGDAPYECRTIKDAACLWVRP